MPIHFIGLFHRGNIYPSLYITESAQPRWHASLRAFASDGVLARYCGVAHAPHTLYQRIPFVVQSPFSRFQPLRRPYTPQKPKIEALTHVVYWRRMPPAALMVMRRNEALAPLSHPNRDRPGCHVWHDTTEHPPPSPPLHPGQRSHKQAIEDEETQKHRAYKSNPLHVLCRSTLRRCISWRVVSNR